MLNPVKFLFLSIVLIFALGGMVIAQETPSAGVMEAVNLDENIQPEDLGVEAPRILPDSPFYFLKNWSREIRSFLAFNPLAKAELKLKFADEKLVEVKKLVELKKDPEIVKKSLENYQKEVDRIKSESDKIKETVEENPEVNKFLDKFIKHQILHQKLLLKLETQVPTEVFEKIKEAREKHLEKFGEVMTKLEDRTEEIREKLEKNMEEIKGSKFKNFKNLEILRDLEEKVPEQAKEAIQKAQENALKRLQGDLEKMSPEDQEKFTDYIQNISGAKEKHLEILQNLKSEIMKVSKTPGIINLKEKLETGEIKTIEIIEGKLEKLDCPQWVSPAPGFCKEGRVILERSPNGCPSPPRCIIPGEVEIERKKLPGLASGECGGIQGIQCKDDYICDCQATRDCSSDMMGLCIKEEKPRPCIALWNPVCGKNGKTYSNACFAKLAGVEIEYKERCSEKKCLTDADCPQLKCAPLSEVATKCMGVGTKCVEGKCQTISIPTIKE